LNIEACTYSNLFKLADIFSTFLKLDSESHLWFLHVTIYAKQNILEGKQTSVSAVSHGREQHEASVPQSANNRFLANMGLIVVFYYYYYYYYLLLYLIIF
jgi:hypothetical protein